MAEVDALYVPAKQVKLVAVPAKAGLIKRQPKKKKTDNLMSKKNVVFSIFDN